MTGVSNQDEYNLPNGQTVSIQQNDVGGIWEVACWNPDGTAHWYKEYDKEGEAREEFERWR